ncbi:MAG: TrkH family potassium uptake protein [Lachnotalea sp.]
MLSKDKFEKVIKFNTTQLIATGFFGVILIGTFFLMLPIATSAGNTTKFIDALFTSATSVCVTGLTTVSTAGHWSIFGKLIILILAQLGGLGVVTCATMFLIITNKRITLNERIIISESYGLDTMEGMVKLIKRIIKGTFVVEAIGAIFYSIQFIPEYDFFPGVWRAIFNSVSAFCNAGMDILGDTSLQNYQTNVLVNFTTMALIVTGGIGFTVWWDFIHVLKEVRRKRVRKKKIFASLSLHAKLAIVTTIILLMSGFIIFLLFEYNNVNTIGNMSMGNKMMAALFQSVTTRTAGFFTIPQENFTNASAMVSMILMFIGGSPAGTAGGMKTTTIAMLLITTVSFVRGRRDTEVFNRKIASENIRLGLAVVTVGIIVLITAITLLCATEKAPFLDILYEVTSALGTVGLSRGLTPKLSTIGKLIIVVVMYIGRIGPITLVAALSINRNNTKKGIELPEKRIIVG